MALAKRQRFIRVFAALALLACSSSSTAPTAPVDGDYTLDSVAGKPLPVFTFAFEGGNYYIVSMQVHLSTGGRLAPYYAATERDSVSFADGKPILSSSTYGGGLSLVGGDSIALDNFPAATGAGAILGQSFTIATSAGEMHFTRER